MATVTRTGETVDLSPREVAEAIWSMGSDEQAEMLHHLIITAGSEHTLMTQFLAVREDCEKRDTPDAIECFQSMFASAYKYMWK